MEAGKVQGIQLIELFKQVVESRIIISMQIAGTSYQRLICITACKPEATGYRLLIDAPKDFKEAVGLAGSRDLRFNFNGPDHLEYFFNSSVGRIAGDELVVPFPEYAERLQRRRNFRIDAPPRSRIRFETDGVKFLLQMINISLGGALGAMARQKTSNLREAGLRPDQRIFRLVLTFPPEGKTPEQIIFISTAAVIRIEFDREKKIHRYAFEFVELEQDQKNKLTEAVYRLQRQYLRRR